MRPFPNAAVRHRVLPLGIGLAVGGCVIAGWYGWQPINDAAARAGILSGIAIGSAGAVMASWRSRAGIAALVAVAVIGCASLLQPGLDVRGGDYATALLAYRGTPYIWGGENRRGIDCSGL